MRYLSLLGGI
jgi:hypothetical protein